MGDKIDLYVYAVDVNEGVMAKVSGSRYNAFVKGEKDLAITLENSVEMRGNHFGYVLKKHGINADLVFLTTDGLVAVMNDCPINIPGSIKGNIAELYGAFDQYFKTRIEQGAHLHEKIGFNKKR